VKSTARNALNWVMIAACLVVVVLALARPIDPTRRALIILASSYIGVRRGIALANRTCG